MPAAQAIPTHKVITAPTGRCRTNETVCCCPGDDYNNPECVRVTQRGYFPDDELED